MEISGAATNKSALTTQSYFVEMIEINNIEISRYAKLGIKK